MATFRAVVTGEPKPTITWARNKGDISDPEKYNTRYDAKVGEYILQVKCYSFLTFFQEHQAKSAIFDYFCLKYFDDNF